MKRIPVTSQFAYVYVVYYLDPHEEGWKIHNDMGFMVCTTLERAFLVAKQHGEKELREINGGRLWQAGNYWIYREAIIDSGKVGLEIDYPSENKRRWPLP